MVVEPHAKSWAKIGLIIGLIVWAGNWLGKFGLCCSRLFWLYENLGWFPCPRLYVLEYRLLFGLTNVAFILSDNIC